MTGSRVLVLEDDTEFRAFVTAELQVAGFQPVEAGTVSEAEEHALRGPERFEALILDVTLPDGDGRDLCARLRAAGLQVPVLMLTGADGEEDIVRGLEAGANDYVAKPCSAGVLIARLRTQMRLHENSMDAVFSLGPWQFHPALKLLRDSQGMRIWLTPKEVDILRYLQRNGGIVSKHALLAEVWGYNPSVSSHTLETHIYRLRQKIEVNPSAARLLLTAEGGYQLASA